MVSVFATVAVAALAAASVIPLVSVSSEAQASELDPASLYATTIADAQVYSATGAVTLGFERGSYSAEVIPKPTPTPTPVPASKDEGGEGGEGEEAPAARWAPPFVAPDPGSAQAIAYDMVLARGWGDDQFACLVALWQKESGWRVNAYNRSSGAYGIPQALPGKKMASAGADWETNPATQIAWGLGYIGGRYGDPCGAWDSSKRRGWY